MTRRAFDVEGVVLGLCLVGLGWVLTLGSLGRLDALTTLRTYWPVSLVIWGAVEFVAMTVRRRSSH